MNARTRILTVGLFAAVSAVAGCSSDEDAASDTTVAAPVSAADTTAATTAPTVAPTTAETAAPTESAAAGGAAMTIQGFAFSPVTATSGETITITNEDDAPHTVTADDGTFSVEVGTSAELVAPAPGTYAIHCEIHPSMTGSIVVE